MAQGDPITTECLHESLFFGSGDLYLICEECGRFWEMEDSYENNVGEACGLSGEVRSKK